jgi:hypothetical protein
MSEETQTINRTGSDTTLELPFTTPTGVPRGKDDEGPDQMPSALWRTCTGYAGPSLAPDPSPSQQPERRQMTHHRSEVAYISVGARHPNSTRHTNPGQRPNARTPTRGDAPHATHDLTRPTAS